MSVDPGDGRVDPSSLVTRLDADPELLDVFRSAYSGEGDALDMLTRRRDGVSFHDGISQLSRAAFSRHESLADERRAVAALSHALHREENTGRALDAAIAAAERSIQPPEIPDVPGFAVRRGTRTAVAVALAVALIAAASSATTYRPDSLAVFDSAPTSQNQGAPDARAAATRVTGSVEDVRLIGQVDGLDVFAFLDSQFGVCLSAVDTNRQASGSCAQMTDFRERGVFLEVSRKELTSGTVVSIFWGPVGTVRVYPQPVEDVFREGLETRFPSLA